jgi:hypothetical protein
MGYEGTDWQGKRKRRQVHVLHTLLAQVLTNDFSTYILESAHGGRMALAKRYSDRKFTILSITSSISFGRRNPDVHA